MLLSNLHSKSIFVAAAEVRDVLGTCDPSASACLRTPGPWFTPRPPGRPGERASWGWHQGSLPPVGAPIGNLSSAGGQACMYRVLGKPRHTDGEV